MTSFALVKNFMYNYLGTFGFLTFIIDFNFIIILIQIFKHSINLHIFLFMPHIYQKLIF
jgi:hypothetical protein